MTSEIATALERWFSTRPRVEYLLRIARSSGQIDDVDAAAFVSAMLADGDELARLLRESSQVSAPPRVCSTCNDRMPLTQCEVCAMTKAWHERDRLWCQAILAASIGMDNMGTVLDQVMRMRPEGFDEAEHNAAVERYRAELREPLQDSGKETG